MPENKEVEKNNWGNIIFHILFLPIGIYMAIMFLFVGFGIYVDLWTLIFNSEAYKIQSDRVALQFIWLMLVRLIVK